MTDYDYDPSHGRLGPASEFGCLAAQPAANSLGVILSCEASKALHTAHSTTRHTVGLRMIDCS